MDSKCFRDIFRAFLMRSFVGQKNSFVPTLLCRCATLRIWIFANWVFCSGDAPPPFMWHWNFGWGHSVALAISKLTTEVVHGEKRQLKQGSCSADVMLQEPLGINAFHGWPRFTFAEPQREEPQCVSADPGGLFHHS